MGQLTSAAFSLTDGTRLPWRFRLLRAATRGPLLRRLAMSGASGQRVLEQLPAMTARYDDRRVFRIPRGDRTYGRVFFLGEHEPGTSAVVRRLVARSDFAIDVGANHGWFALLMSARAGPGGEVWAIEPLPAAVASLRANLRLNPSLAVRVFDVALGALPGRTTINAFHGLPEVHASGSTLGRSDFEPHAVARETLDGLLEHADRPPSLVKVDVEGGELDVLRGAARLLDSELPPIWILEANRATAAAFGHQPADLLSCLEAHRPHDVYRIGRGGQLEPERAPERAPHGTNWLCVPPERRDRLDRPEPVT